MRQVLILLFLNTIFIQNFNAQTLRNFGNIEIHTDGKLGMFSSLENDGMFFNIGGLAGFYGNLQNSISGSVSPLFYDIEINNDQGIYLDIPIEVSNNTNFIYGDIKTSKFNDTNYLEFLSTSFYSGDSNFSKVDGYLLINDIQSFLFPVGDETYLRPIAVNAETTTAYKCAYFFENGTINFSNSIDPNSEVINISTEEYWKLEGEKKTEITIGWNERSNLQNLVDDVDKITIVGYDTNLNYWVNLATTERSGNINEGFISSTSFIPNQFSAITFGILNKKKTAHLKKYHYLVTPNGDGINDFLFIPELADYTTNVLQIYDRNGLKVFEKENYSNEFNGEVGSNISAINKNSGLPEGIYFYLVKAGKNEFNIQGFLYLERHK